MNKRSIYTLGLMMCLMLNVAAQERLSLSGAIQKALLNNYDILVQQKDQEIAKLNNHWGTAGRYPSINFSVNSNNKYDFNEQDNYAQNILLAGVGMNWTLFNGFKVKITKQRLNELENLSNGRMEVLVEGTIQSLMLAYYNTLLQKEKLEVLKQIAQLSNDRFEYETLRKELGNSVSYEVLQAQNAYLADQSDVLLQEAAFKSAMRELAYLLGDDEDRLYELTDPFEFLIPEYVLGDLKDKLLANNATLQNQYLGQSLLKKDIELSKAAFYPSLTLNAGGQANNTHMNYATDPTVDRFSSNVYGNLALSFTLFNGGIKKRALQVAHLNEEAGKIEIDQMKHDLSNQLSRLFDYFSARKEMLKLANEQMKYAEINLKVSEEKLKAGTINSFNYRDVQLIYQNAAIGRLNAIYNLIDVNTSLLRITGGIVGE